MLAVLWNSSSSFKERKGGVILCVSYVTQVAISNLKGHHHTHTASYRNPLSPTSELVPSHRTRITIKLCLQVPSQRESRESGNVPPPLKKKQSTHTPATHNSLVASRGMGNVFGMFSYVRGPQNLGGYHELVYSIMLRGQQKQKFLPVLEIVCLQGKQKCLRPGRKRSKQPDSGTAFSARIILPPLLGFYEQYNVQTTCNASHLLQEPVHILSLYTENCTPSPNKAGAEWHPTEIWIKNGIQDATSSPNSHANYSKQVNRSARIRQEPWESSARPCSADKKGARKE